jgi:hypothetical protein
LGIPQEALTVWWGSFLEVVCKDFIAGFAGHPELAATVSGTILVAYYGQVSEVT